MQNGANKWQVIAERSSPLFAEQLGDASRRAATEEDLSQAALACLRAARRVSAARIAVEAAADELRVAQSERIFAAEQQRLIEEDLVRQGREVAR